MNLNPAPVNPVAAIKDNFSNYLLRFEHSINDYADNLRNKANQQRFEAAKEEIVPQNRITDSKKFIIPESPAEKEPAKTQVKTRVQKYNSNFSEVSNRYYKMTSTIRDNLDGLITYARVDTLQFIRRSFVVIGFGFIAITYALSLLNLAKPIPMMPRF